MSDLSSSANIMPADIATLQAMVAERDTMVTERDSVIMQLKHEIMLLHQWRFGRKSEKFNAAGQASLLESILKRAGVDIRRSTMADWMAYVGHSVICLVDEMKRLMLESTVIHTDDTPVTVQDPKGKAKPHIGRIWICSGDRNHPYDIYEFTPDRKQIHPQSVLSGFKGFLQADAYNGYDALFNGDIVEVACWAQARWKFVEAKKSDKRAAEILALISQLYRVEKKSKPSAKDSAGVPR